MPTAAALAAGLMLLSPALAAERLDGERLAGEPTGWAQEIWQIEILRLPADALVTLLADPDPAVRARAARAVGRLRDGAAGVRVLTPIVGDPDPVVRREVAFALGQTAGSGELLARRWAAETDPRVRGDLATALGKQGGPEAVDILVEALTGRTSLPAADGLGRLGIRKVQGASSDAVVAALLDTLDRLPIDDTGRRAAWALGRMGLSHTSDENARRMRDAVLGHGDARVRAWLLRAWAGVSAEGSRAEVFARTAGDPSPAVRVATAREVAKNGWEGAAPILVRLLGDGELGVRLETIAAVGACPKVDARALLSSAWASKDPVERAAALRILAKADALPAPLESWFTADHPMVLRVAAIESSRDRPALLRLALGSEEPPIRSAATGTLLSEGTPRPAELLDLLRAKDLAVAQSAADAIREHPDPGAQRPLLDLLSRADLPPELAESAVRALAAIYATGRLPRPGDEAAAILRPWLRLRRLSDLAERFAALTQVDPPRPRHPALSLPSLTEVLAIRSARIHTTRGEIRVDFDTAEAPLTVWNFATLAESNYFDGLQFHRVVPDFVVQTGDPRGDGWGGPGYEMPDEINPLPYTTGTVGMALSGPDTGGSQWFITLAPQPHLDGTYTVFGHVTYGMGAAGAIEVGDRITDIEIERITVVSGL